MAIDYDNDPRYEFLEDNVYFDTQTNETVFLLDEENSEKLEAIVALDDTIFEKNDTHGYTLTAEGAKKLLANMIDSDLTDLD